MSNEAVSAVESGRSAFHVNITAHDVQIGADEPISAGGLGLALTTFELLSAALAACTTMTLRMYSNRKQWSLKSIRTDVSHTRTSGQTAQDYFARVIHLDGVLDEQQVARLLAVANHCPVHLALERGSKIGTHVEMA
ncbi:MAG TPA: OsmC family protein [Steroidobacteraceae bacterium]